MAKYGIAVNERERRIINEQTGKSPAPVVTGHEAQEAAYAGGGTGGIGLTAALHEALKVPTKAISYEPKADVAPASIVSQEVFKAALQAALAKWNIQSDKPKEGGDAREKIHPVHHAGDGRTDVPAAKVDSESSMSSSKPVVNIVVSDEDGTSPPTAVSTTTSDWVRLDQC